MTTDEMIAVLEAHKRGEKIEVSTMPVSDRWFPVKPGDTIFDFCSFDYRIANRGRTTAKMAFDAVYHARTKPKEECMLPEEVRAMVMAGAVVRIDLVQMLRKSAKELAPFQNTWLLTAAADEIEELRQQLAECERENKKLRHEIAVMTCGVDEQLATVTKERDEARSEIIRLTLRSPTYEEFREQLTELQRDRDELKRTIHFALGFIESDGEAECMRALQRTGISGHSIFGECKQCHGADVTGYEDLESSAKSKAEVIRWFREESKRADSLQLELSEAQQQLATVTAERDELKANSERYELLREMKLYEMMEYRCLPVPIEDADDWFDAQTDAKIRARYPRATIGAGGKGDAE